MKKLTYFKSITSKIRLIIFVTILSLIFIYINSTAYQNSLNNLHNQVAKISQQKESLRSLKTILLSSLLILDKIIYEDNQELIPKLFAFNEDTLGVFERFKYTAEYQEQQFDYYFAVENENVVLQIRKDFYQSVALYQAGEIEKAKQYKRALLEPKINHIEIFIENAEELQKIQLADLNVLIQEQTRNTNPFKNATVFYLIILIIVVALILFISEKISLTEKALKLSEEKYAKAYKAVPNSLSITTLNDGVFIEVNEGTVKIYGYDREELIGNSIIDLGLWVDVLDREKLIKKVSNEGAISDFETKFQVKNGDVRDMLLSAEIIEINKELCMLINAQDITERKQSDERLSNQASHDILTGLVNRREFERRTECLLETIQQDKGTHALCFMDLDQFKVVNDTCGHIAGDELLRQLSAMLKKIVRHSDTLARLGGDEFGILMEQCSLDDAQRVTTSVLTAIQDYQFSWEGYSFRLGISIGLVPITDSKSNLTELLKQADAACYVAKDAGRNRIHVHHDDDSEMAERHGEMQWVTRISKALEQDLFCLYAQSIVPLYGSTDRHYELLIRMLGDKGEIIPPGAFLSAAERYNLISKLDHWVIDNSFSLLAEYPAFLKQINFCSINLSGQSLTEPEILKFIISRLNECGINGNKICFEITETAAISNLNMATQFISTLKALGCRFALDDFGSGLSSFGYLKNLSVDYLKIDGMFVKDIIDDPIDHAMVKSINEIGHVMGMKTIAEFVENDEIKGMLKEIGVDFAQGYGIGKPQPFNELLIRSNNVTNIKNNSVV